MNLISSKAVSKLVSMKLVLGLALKFRRWPDFARCFEFPLETAFNGEDHLRPLSSNTSQRPSMTGISMDFHVKLGCLGPSKTPKIDGNECYPDGKTQHQHYSPIKSGHLGPSPH